LLHRLTETDHNHEYDYSYYSDLSTRTTTLT
jgi:hypothetical protein